MNSIPWTVLAWIFGPIAAWCALSWLVSLAAGWTKLAKRFRAREKPDGQAFWFQYALMNGAQYKGCLTVRVSPRGLHLSVLPPFRFAHPPLLIPWEYLGPFQLQKVMWLSTQATTVKLGKFDSVKIEFTSAALVEAMRAYLPTS